MPSFNHGRRVGAWKGPAGSVPRIGPGAGSDRTRRSSMAALTHTHTTATYLAPGQRYTPQGSAGWRFDRQLTVLMVGRDRQGQVRVAYRCPNGHQVVEPAAQFE